SRPPMTIAPTLREGPFAAYGVLPRCRSSSPEDGVGHEARGVLGDGGGVLAYADAGGRLAGHPAAAQRICAVESGHLPQLLHDEAVVAVEPAVPVDHPAAVDQRHVLALAGVD